MSKITLTDVKGGFNLTAIQSNFDALETELQGKVFYRNNPVGEPNTMETDVDMNNKRILNLPEPLSDNEPLRKRDAGSLSSLIASAAGYASTTSIKAAEATASASSASGSAASATASANAASASAIAAAASAVAAEDSSRLTVGTTTTGAAGSSASVTITGSPGAQALNLTIPRGDTGATGAAGAGITPQAVGFTLTGGTTPKTLTVASNANVSGTNTGDQTSVTGNAGTVTNGVYTTDKDASGGVPGLTLFKLNLRNAANTITSWFTTAATVARTWTMPDKDGTVAMTSDVVAATQQHAHNFVTSAGTSTAYTATLTPAITAYTDGLSFMLRMHATNGASPTLAVNGLAALPMWRRSGAVSGGAVVVTSAGELQQYHYYYFVYSAVSGIWWVDSNPLVMGYTPGTGGTVTQATSKSTAVTLNKPTGAITTASDALASNAVAFFIVNNSLVSADDTVVVSLRSGDATGGSYGIQVLAVQAGGFYIQIRNQSAGSRSEALVINFAVIKGATS